MKTRILLFSLILIFSTLLTACSGGVYTASGWPSVNVKDNLAYLANGQFLYAIDVTTGAEQWRYPPDKAGSDNFYATPILTPDGKLIIGSYQHNLYSVNVDTRIADWKFAEAKDHYVASQLVSEKGIFAPSADGSLYALDFTGQPLWTNPFRIKSSFWAQPTSDPECQCLFITGMDHHLYSIDARSGEKLWDQDLGGASVASPTYVDGKLYVGSFAKELLTIDAQTGQILKRFSTEDWVWAGPAVAFDRLYFGDLKGNLYILDVASGNQIAKVASDGGITGTPLVLNDVIYFTTQAGSLYGIDKDGKPAWTEPVKTGGQLFGSPVAAGDLILVPQIGSKTPLLAYDSNGVQKWAFTPK